MRTVDTRALAPLESSSRFDLLAGSTAVAAGLTGFLYAVSFILIQPRAAALGMLLSALFLTLAGLLQTPALVGVYQRVRHADTSFALWALALALAGALGAAIHGGYDLANAIHPPIGLSSGPPSQIDPRGLLTFGVAGLGLGAGSA